MLLADIEHHEQIPVLDQIHVEKGYEKALASALGDDLTAPLQPEKTTVFKGTGLVSLVRNLVRAAARATSWLVMLKHLQN